MEDNNNLRNQELDDVEKLKNLDNQLNTLKIVERFNNCILILLITLNIPLILFTILGMLA